jgi:membrane fusion protein, multidrug efflux system
MTCSIFGKNNKEPFPEHEIHCNSICYRKSFRERYWLFIPVLFLVITVSFSCSNRTEPVQTVSRPRTVVISEVQRMDLSSVRRVAAPVIAYKRVYITALTGGQILELYFEEGERVKKGELLARIDTRRQKAQLRNAESALEEARRNFSRIDELYASRVVSESDHDLTQRRLEEAESEVQLWRAEVELGDIYAPIDAVVSAKLVEVGTTVPVNERLFTIEDHNLLVVRPGVSELDVAFLEEGQELEIEFDVFDQDLFKGQIRRIFPAADRITRLFTVEVEIFQPDAGRIIRPGYLARVHFVTDHRNNVLAVPPEALTLRDGENLAFAVDHNRKLEIRKVQTGIQRDGWVEVTGGLEEGEKIVAGNLSALKDGMEVSIAGIFRRYGFRE